MTATTREMAARAGNRRAVSPCSTPMAGCYSSVHRVVADFVGCQIGVDRIGIDGRNVAQHIVDAVVVAVVITVVVDVLLGHRLSGVVQTADQFQDQVCGNGEKRDGGRTARSRSRAVQLRPDGIMNRGCTPVRADRPAPVRFTMWALPSTRISVPGTE